MTEAGGTPGDSADDSDHDGTPSPTDADPDSNEEAAQRAQREAEIRRALNLRTLAARAQEAQSREVNVETPAEGPRYRSPFSGSLRGTSDIDRQDQVNLRDLRKEYGQKLLQVLKWQVIGTNVAMGVYIIAEIVFAAFDRGHQLDIPSEVMVAWIVSTLAEVIAVPAIIVRSLFPSRDRSE